MSVKLLGVKIDTYTKDEALDLALSLVDAELPSQVVTINPEMIEYAAGNADFAEIVENAELVIPDGVGVKIGLKLNGCNVDRIPGIDFARSLLEIVSQKNLPIAIVGAKEEVIVKAIDNLKKEIQGFNLVYYHNGYFEDEQVIIEELKDREPQLILVAMGSPRQELFIAKSKKILSKGLMIGIGGSLDIWSGNVKRAPLLYQKLGLEWLYRTINEPARFKRIFPTLPRFVLKSLFYRIKK